MRRQKELVKNTKITSRTQLNHESRRHTVVTATNSFKTKSQFELWTSLIHGSKLEEETLKEKMKTGGGEGDGGSLILFNRAITHSQFCPWIQMS